MPHLLRLHLTRGTMQVMHLGMSDAPGTTSSTVRLISLARQVTRLVEGGGEEIEVIMDRPHFFGAFRKSIVQEVMDHLHLRIASKFWQTRRPGWCKTFLLYVNRYRLI